MKKYVILLCLLALGMSGYARKSYVNVTVKEILLNGNSHYSKLRGDVPADMQDIYYAGFDEKDIGDVLNMLSERGFEVEFMCTAGTDNSINYLLSKSEPDTSLAERIEHVTSDGGEATEVARYNLQGIPVNPDEKGVQIIVFSNYTTRTVIVE